MHVLIDCYIGSNSFSKLEALGFSLSRVDVERISSLDTGVSTWIKINSGDLLKELKTICQKKRKSNYGTNYTLFSSYSFLQMLAMFD